MEFNYTEESLASRGGGGGGGGGCLPFLFDLSIDHQLFKIDHLEHRYSNNNNYSDSSSNSNCSGSNSNSSSSSNNSCSSNSSSDSNISNISSSINNSNSRREFSSPQSEFLSLSLQNACIIGIDTETRPTKYLWRERNRERRYNSNSNSNRGGEGGGESKEEEKGHDVIRLPTALLQIATRDKSNGEEMVFLIDLLALSRQSDLASDKAVGLSVLDDMLAPVMQSSSVIKLGQGLARDLEELVHSYPAMQAFRSVNNIVEMNSLNTYLESSPKKCDDEALIPPPCLNAKKSLKFLVTKYLHNELDKIEQVSDWGKRPLTFRQVLYAACDALVLLRLFDVMVCDGIDKYNEDKLNSADSNNNNNSHEQNIETIVNLVTENFVYSLKSEKKKAKKKKKSTSKDDKLLSSNAETSITLEDITRQYYNNAQRNGAKSALDLGKRKHLIFEEEVETSSEMTDVISVDSISPTEDSSSNFSNSTSCISSSEVSCEDSTDNCSQDKITSGYIEKKRRLINIYGGSINSGSSSGSSVSSYESSGGLRGTRSKEKSHRKLGIIASNWRPVHLMFSNLK